MTNRHLWKQFSIMLLMLTLQQSLFSQMITIKVSDSFDYTQNSDSFTFYIVEELKYLQVRRSNEETRESEFNLRVEDLHNFLDENNFIYEIKPISEIIKESQAKKKMVLKRHDLIIYNDSSTRGLIIEFVKNQKGILFRYHPLEAPLDEAFIKSCINALSIQARKEAEPYAQSQDKTCGEIHEMKIIQQITNTKRERHSTVDTATHVASFTIEFSFLTVDNK